jgi:hypothetical protein
MPPILVDSSPSRRTDLTCLAGLGQATADVELVCMRFTKKKKKKKKRKKDGRLEENKTEIVLK